MDPLTHVFLPLTGAYVLCPKQFNRQWCLAFGLFGLVPDFDKFLGMPGLFHSIITLVPLCLLLLAVEYKGREQINYSGLAVFFIASHLLLDLLDGSGIYLLYPFVRTGIGLQYPMQIGFGEGVLGFTFHGPPVSLFFTTPRPGFAGDATTNADVYGFIEGFGIASTILFVIIYLGLERRSTYQ